MLFCMMVEDEVVASHEDTLFASTSSSPPLTTTTTSFAFESEKIGWERVADENSASQGFNDGGDDDSLCFIICLEVALFRSMVVLDL